MFGEVPENLPGPLYARKVQRRAASSGSDFPGVEGPLRSVRDELDELQAAQTPDERFHELGDVLFAVVNVARKLRVDPELALRAASDRFRSRVSAGEELAAANNYSQPRRLCRPNAPASQCLQSSNFADVDVATFAYASPRVLFLALFFQVSSPCWADPVIASASAENQSSPSRSADVRGNSAGSISNMVGRWGLGDGQWSADTTWSQGLAVGMNGPIPVIVVDQFGYPTKSFQSCRDPRSRGGLR